jgi:hypothetical protein
MYSILETLDSLIVITILFETYQPSFPDILNLIVLIKDIHITVTLDSYIQWITTL